MPYGQEEVLFVENCAFWEEKGKKITMDAAFQHSKNVSDFFQFPIFVVCPNHSIVILSSSTVQINISTVLF